MRDTEASEPANVRQIISKKEFAERMGCCVRHPTHDRHRRRAPDHQTWSSRSRNRRSRRRSLARLASRCAAGMARLSGSCLTPRGPGAGR